MRAWAEGELLIAGPELNDAVAARVCLNFGRDLRIGLAHEHSGSEQGNMVVLEIRGDGESDVALLLQGDWEFRYRQSPNRRLSNLENRRRDLDALGWDYSRYHIRSIDVDWVVDVCVLNLIWARVILILELAIVKGESEAAPFSWHDGVPEAATLEGDGFASVPQLRFQVTVHDC